MKRKSKKQILIISKNTVQSINEPDYMIRPPCPDCEEIETPKTVIHDKEFCPVCFRCFCVHCMAALEIFQQRIKSIKKEGEKVKEAIREFKGV